MAVIETWLNQDLQKPVKVQYIDGSLFSNNANGNRIGVVVTDNGEPVTISGTVSGYVVVSDGSTVPCTGAKSGNRASILIPPAAYVPGSAFISLFVTDGTTVTTLAALSTTVLQTRTGTQVDPGSVVTDWTQTINGAMQDVQTAAANLGGIVATPYASLTYPVPLGKYTYYDGGLYRCISPIASSETFTPAHWTAVKLGDDVSALKSALNANGKEEDIFGMLSLTEGWRLTNDGGTEENTMMAYSDYIEIPKDAKSITLGNLTATNSNSQTYHVSPNVLFYDKNKTFLSYKKNTTNDIATYELVYNAAYIRVNQASEYAGSLKKQYVRFNSYVVGMDIVGVIGSQTISFTANKQQKSTTFPVEAGKTYKIVCTSEVAEGRVNVYSNGNANNYIRVEGKRSYIFNCTDNGTLYAYNIGFTGTFSIVVYELGTIPYYNTSLPKIYHVGWANWQPFSSLTALLLALKDDDSEKTIYLHGRDYDIFQEYTDLGLLNGDPPSNPTLDFRSYNVWVPSNTKIIGDGIARLIFEPTTSQISIPWSNTISVLNTMGNVTIENIEIHAKNCRYCIHDDYQQESVFANTKRVFRNVKIFKKTNDTGYGKNSTIGFGCCRGNEYIFEDCYLYNQSGGNAFYFHSTPTDRDGTVGLTDSPTIVANNCIFDSNRGVKFGNVSGAETQRIRAGFNNCYIGGQLRVCDEDDLYTGTVQNVFDITLLNCGAVNKQMISTTNPYPIKEYPPQ